MLFYYTLFQFMVPTFLCGFLGNRFWKTELLVKDAVSPTVPPPDRFGLISLKA